MNANQSLKANPDKGFNRPVSMKGFLCTAGHFLLPFISQVIELIFPGMLNGQVLTPEMITGFIKSIFHSF